MENAPVGADYERNAPWRTDNVPEIKKVRVTVSICMSREFEIEVPEGHEEDTNYLTRNLKTQHILPYEVPYYIREGEPQETLNQLKADMHDWVVDDFTVIPEEKTDII